MGDLIRDWQWPEARQSLGREIWLNRAEASLPGHGIVAVVGICRSWRERGFINRDGRISLAEGATAMVFPDFVRRCLCAIARTRADSVRFHA